MKRNIIIFVVAMATALCSCTRYQNATMHNDSEIAPAMDSLFLSMFAADEPGAIVGVAVDGKPVYVQGFGRARLDNNAPYTDSTLTNICSATKSFTTAAVMKLVEQGRLSLDQSVADFYPNFNRKVFEPITIRHILAHTTGLPDNRPRNAQEWDSYVKNHDTKFGYREDFVLYGREPEMIRYFETIDTVKDLPGTVYHYQDPPFMLLSGIIEQTAGMPFVTYMRDSIFEPAGLKETMFFEPDNHSPNRAHGYTPANEDDADPELEYTTKEGSWEEFDYGEAAFFPTRADRGIYTTARDYFHWIDALYQGDIITSKSIKERYHKQVDTGLDNIGYGLGVYVDDNPDIPDKAFHMSYNGGFSIYQCYFPEKRIFVFVFSNRPDWKRLETGKKIDQILRRYGWI